jgi:pyruvate/2-oxoglutarate dehydrogenase complex dihydrolipoamide acyltransferase (E2) component
MTEGAISEWLIQDGDAVEQGQPLYTLETDETQTEIESPAAGKITIIGKSTPPAMPAP